MKLKHIAAAVALMASGSAFAGATGNVGAFSEYLFRGLEQSEGVAVQGGLDYSHGSGLYVGTWLSNLSKDLYGPGAYEADLYAGFAGKAGDVGFDVGYIFYGYRKSPKANYSEVYAGASFGPLSAKLFFSPEFGLSEDEGFYVTTSYAVPLSSTLTLTPQVGYSWGDGVEESNFAGAEDAYLDYSLTLSKTLEGGMTFSLAVVGTDTGDADVDEDREQVVLGLKKVFDL